MCEEIKSKITKHFKIVRQFNDVNLTSIQPGASANSATKLGTRKRTTKAALNSNFDQYPLFTNSDFLSIYKIHFILTKNLRLTLYNYYYSNNNEKLKDFAQILTSQIFSYTDTDLSLAFLVETKYLNETIYPEKKKINIKYNVIFKNKSTSRMHYSIKNLEDVKKIKKFSSNSRDGNIIVVWNVETLETYINNNHTSVVPKARNNYIIFFVAPLEEYCNSMTEYLGKVLMRFWKQFDAFNVIALTPSTPCKSNTVFTYKPFYKIDESHWGIVENFTIDEVKSNHALIINSLSNFNELSLPISIFERMPTATRRIPESLQITPMYSNLKRSKGYGGLDGCVLNELAKHLNFTVNVADDNNFGTVLPNKTATNSLGNVIDRRVQFSANGRFLIDYGINGFEFSVPYSVDKICAITPKAKKIPQWMIFFKCFHRFTWSGIFLVVFIASFAGYFLSKLEEKQKRSYFRTFNLLIGIPTRTSPILNQSFFHISCMIFNIIIVGIIQGSMFTSLTKPLYYNDIRSLQALADSNLQISSALLDQFQNDESPLMKKLRKNRINPMHNVFESIIRDNIATFQRINDVKSFISMIYWNEDGPLLNIVDECAATYYMAYILPKGSPFLAKFNNIIAILAESGITTKWYDDVTEANALKFVGIYKKSKKHISHRPFSLRDIQIALYVLFLGSLISIGVFFSEVLTKIVRKNSMQNNT